MLAQNNALPPQFSPLSIARMLWKQKLWVGLIWGSLTAIVVVVVHRIPALYKSEALILVDSQKIPERYVSSTVNNEVGDRLATISQQILSSTALKKVMDDFDLYHEESKTLAYEEVMEKMRSDIEIKLSKGWSGNRPGAFHVAYKGGNPAVVASVANRIANLFVEENLRSREAQAQGTSEFIVNELQSAKAKLDELELALSKYKLGHNGGLPQQENSLLGSLTRMQIELQGNQDALNRAQQNKVMLENSLTIAEAAETALNSPAERPRPSTNGKSEPSGDANSAVSRRRSESVEEQLTIARAQYAEGHPAVKRLRDELAAVRAIEQREEAQAASVAQRHRATGEENSLNIKDAGYVPPGMTIERLHQRERVTAIKAQLSLTNDEIQRRSDEQQKIRKDAAELQSRVEALPVREQEMASLSRDYDISKANYRSLLDKKLAADMAAEMERRQKAERFTIIDPARVPTKPFSPNRPAFYGIGSLVALAAGLAFALARELKKDAVLGEWELPKEFAILGRVPKIEFAGSRTLPRANQTGPAPDLVEQLRPAGGL